MFAIEDIHGNFRDKYKDNNIIPMLERTYRANLDYSKGTER